jgi:putative hydrolase of the HAD superfamily
MIYFDLDHTLWDFEKNSKETLNRVFHNYHKIFMKTSLEDFIDSYLKINSKLWEMYRNKEISHDDLKLLRFEITLNALKIKHKESLVREMNDFYLKTLAQQKHLVEGAFEVLDYLKENYELGILTNGFKNTQITKMKSSQIIDYFNILVSSDDVGVPKPDEKIFEYAVIVAKKSKEEILYIGDDLENDILPALKYGMKAIWFKNHQNKTESTENGILSINKLVELKNIF